MQTDAEKIRDFTTLVAEMREAQNQYFKSRDPSILQQAKTKERRVDAMIIELGKPITGQRKLFEY